MRGIVYHGAGDMRVESVPDPKPQDARSAIVRVEATAICGSDLHLYHGLMMTEGPFTVGHEFIGEVVEVGSEVRNFKSGDRVIVAGVIGCGDCDSCRRGEVVRCLNHMNRVFGVMPDLPGGQAEAVAVPGADYSMTLMPDGISQEQAVLLTDILPTGFFGAKSARIQPGDTVAILGAGPVGIQALVCAQLYGPSRVIVVDPVPERRALAVSLGAEAVTPDNALMHVIEATGGQGADAVIEAVGAQETIHSGMMLARPGAVLAVIGVNLEMDFPLPMPLAVTKDLTMTFGVVPVPEFWPALIPLLQSGRIRPEVAFSHRLGLSEGAEAYRRFDKREDGFMKVLLDPTS